MSDADPQNVRGWLGPIGNSAEDERRAPVPSAAPESRPWVAIAEALSNNWFEVWYQPKIDLKRKYLAGAQALARIRHPQRGVLSPGSFLPIADDDSAMEIVRRALQATLVDWTAFEEAGFNLHLAINMPVGVLLKLPVARLVGDHRPQSARWPGLILEVTEDQIIRDVALAKKIATEMRVGGITFAIGSFGAGYSSFSSLRDLPFAELKIDRSFVVGCATDATNAAICQTAIDLAHRFGSAAVAEGVASAADLQALMVMGCDFGQGPLMAPPMPKEAFLGLLRQRMNVPRAAAGKAPASGNGSVGRVA